MYFTYAGHNLPCFISVTIKGLKNKMLLVKKYIFWANGCNVFLFPFFFFLGWG